MSKVTGIGHSEKGNGESVIEWVEGVSGVSGESRPGGISADVSHRDRVTLLGTNGGAAAENIGVLDL